MDNEKRNLGAYGERLAARYLESHGYIVVDTNWSCQHGELDIIARQGETLVFIEVRTRRSPTVESAFLSVDARKQKKLATLAQLYLAEHDLEAAAWRIDVIAVAVPRRGQPIVEHAEDALGWQ